MRIPSGVTDQYIYFVAVDATDFTTREASLTTPTVYRSRNGAAAAAMTTPTIAAVDATNMVGVFSLLLDEDMTIGAGNDSEEMVFHIAATEMAPVTRTIELYRPKITTGNTLGVAADGDVSGNVDGSVASVVGHTAQTGDSFARLGAPIAASISADIAVVDGIVDNILVDTGTTLDTKINDLQGAGFVSATHSNEALRVRGDAAWTGSAVTSHSGTAQAGSASTITLESGASTANSTYVGQVVYISSGTGAGQSRAIASYTGGSLVADVISDWAVAPSSDSVYDIYPDDITEIAAAPTAAVIADAVWDENTAGHTTGGTFGEQCKNDIDAILTDTGTTLPADIATVDANVDAILVDTDTTIPGLIATVDANVDAILVDTDATIPGLIATVDANVDAVLLDTAEIGAAGAGLTAIITPLATVDANVDAILVDTDATIPGLITTVDTVVDAIKLKTDDLTFTKALELDVNTQSLNGAEITGDGNAAPWDGV